MRHPWLAALVLPLAARAQSAPNPAPASAVSAPAAARPAPGAVLELPGGTCTAPQPDNALFAALVQRGTRVVINLRKPSEHDAESEAAAARDAGLLYFTIPVDGAAPQDAQVAEFLQLMARHEKRGVFFHCHSGNRSGAFWLIKRMLQDGWDEARAIAEAEAIGMRSPQLKAFALDYVRRHAAPAASAPRSAP